jgi:hypothetical protein
MNARYYDPTTGRFISEDSYRGDGETFWHLYAYCGGDPVNNTDPSGHRYSIKKWIYVYNRKTMSYYSFTQYIFPYDNIRRYAEGGELAWAMGVAALILRSTPIGIMLSISQLEALIIKRLQKKWND